ncbi:hypothetical protein FACS1894166_10220 [Bacilli bacterium]|nr:hypothetical protein FACS1894166_10220 [Bacilli bacterium]
MRIGIDYIYNHKEINESEVSALSEAVGARIAQDLDIDLKNIYELLANQHLVGLENKFYLKQLLTILVEKFGPSYQNIPIKKLLDTTNDSINDLMSLEREKIVNNVSPLKQSTKQNTKIIKSEDK